MNFIKKKKIRRTRKLFYFSMIPTHEVQLASSFPENKSSISEQKGCLDARFLIIDLRMVNNTIKLSQAGTR